MEADLAVTLLCEQIFRPQPHEGIGTLLQVRSSHIEAQDAGTFFLVPHRLATVVYHGAVEHRQVLEKPGPAVFGKGGRPGDQFGRPGARRYGLAGIATAEEHKEEYGKGMSSHLGFRHETQTYRNSTGKRKF